MESVSGPRDMLEKGIFEAEKIAYGVAGAEEGECGWGVEKGEEDVEGGGGPGGVGGEGGGDVRGWGWGDEG